MEIKDRIIEFLRAENISSANFAQEIGVQPSGISHIISGRNKPSLDFIVKMLNRYPLLSTEWLLFGKGKMLKEGIPGDLFSGDMNSNEPETQINDILEVSGTGDGSSLTGNQIDSEANTNSSASAGGRKTDRIVIFYNDNTYKEYFPR
jgi:transcriptional regulator with XRE-family HTH domain